jgi:hypothetical protein
MSVGVVRSLSDSERENCGHWHRYSFGVLIDRSVLFHVCDDRRQGIDRLSSDSRAAPRRPALKRVEERATVNDVPGLEHCVGASMPESRLFQRRDAFLD